MHWVGRSFVVVSLFLAAPLTGARAQDESKNQVLTADQFTEALLQRLSTHNYFSKIGLVQERSYAPLVMLIQKPSLETPNYAKVIADAHGPWLRKLEDVFRAQYVEPLKLVRRNDEPVQAVAVLQTTGDYFNYQQIIDLQHIGSRFAYFEHRARLLVTYHEGAAAQGVPSNYPELVEYVRGLLHAYYSGPRNEIAQMWIAEGLGGYLAFHVGNQVASLDQRALDTRAVELLVTTSQSAKRRPLYLLPFATIVEIGNVNEWGRAFDAPMENASAEDFDPRLFWPAARAQCALWMHFLHEGEQGKYRPLLMTYLANALRGNGGLEALRGAFKGVEIATLDRAFYAWLYASYQAANPQKPLDLAVLDSLFKAPAAPVTARPEAEVAAPAKKAPAAFDPRTLAVSSDDLDATHGLVLQRIRGGDLDGALKQLVELDARARGAPIEERLTRELARLKLLIALRDAYFAELVASPDKHTFEHGGKKVLAKVVKVENGELVLGENRAKLERLPVSSVAPLEIARDLSKQLADSPDGWIRNYAFVLEGDERWKRGLVGDARPIAELRADAQLWYPAALRFGAVAQALGQLAEAGAPNDVLAGRTCIERIRALLTNWGQLQVVIDHRAGLVSLAALALAPQFSPQMLLTQFAGKLELLDGGRARVTYEFDKPQEFADFVKVEQYLPDWHAHRSPLRKSEQQTAFVVERGLLHGNGNACYRLPLAFEAPVTARYAYQSYCEGTNYADFGSCMICLCDDGKSNYVGCEGLGGLRAIDQPSHYDERDYPPVTRMDPQHSYAIEMRIAGTRCASFVDGAPAQELSIGPRNRGDVLLAVHSDCEIELGRLQVEGQLDLDRMRSRWVAKQLAAMGLAAQ